MLDPLYHAVAWIIVQIHAGLAAINLPEGAAWALAIVLLTMAMRLVLFPLFVKQIKTQRAMQVLQPKMKELQQKYKGDRERLNAEMMALYKEHGANPLSGCLPLLLQIPIFIALFHVLNEIKPHVDKTAPGGYSFDNVTVIGFPQHLIENAARAKIFGVPIAAAFNSSPELLKFLDASATSAKVLTTVMIVLMGVTTFITQRQLIARQGTVAEGAMATQQKVLLYVLPFTFGIFGFRFPLGVLLYWLTTNVWSMAQQYAILHRMGPGPAVAGAGGGAAASTAKRTPEAPRPKAPRPPAGPPEQGKPGTAGTGAPGGQGGGGAPSKPTPGASGARPRRPGGSRNKSRKARRGRRR